MNSDDTTQVIREFVLTCFYVPEASELANDMLLIESGIVDSTGVLELTAFLEATFGVSVAESEIVPENFESIERIAAFVNRKLETRRASRASAHHEAQA